MSSGPRPLTSKDTPTDGSDTAGDRKQAMGRRRRVARGDAGAADATSLREAQEYILAGLRLAPHNALFSEFHDILLTSSVDVEQAIKRRELIYGRDPGNVRNLLWLATLYQRQWMGFTPEQKVQKPNLAADLLQKELSKHSDSLDLVNVYMDM